MTATRGPCSPWNPIWCCDLTSASPITTGQALQAATEILYNLSAQQFGICEFTIRPCRRVCYADSWWSYGSWFGWGSWIGGTWPWPALIGGNWYNLTCGACSDTCSCTPISEAFLPGPVSSIVNVKLNGATLPASGYRVDDFRKLVRLGGLSWPECQDMTLADDQPNTWSVTLNIGQEVPTIGSLAVGELACEIRRSCVEQCGIPRTASSITRQGVTIDLVTISELLRNGLLGLRWADVFVSTYNPRRLLSRPQVYDVDSEYFRRTNT